MLISLPGSIKVLLVGLVSWWSKSSNYLQSMPPHELEICSNFALFNISMKELMSNPMGIMCTSGIVPHDKLFKYRKKQKQDHYTTKILV
jgi:hypothetical protein